MAPTKLIDESDSSEATVLLVKIFEWLDAASIKYCVERNYQGYPETLTGDLDLVVSDNSVIEVARGLATIANGMGWFLYQDHIWEKSAYLGFGKSVFPNRFALTVELFAGARWHGLPYLPALEVLERRLKCGVTWRPCSAHQAVITSIHHLLYNGQVPEKYRSEVFTLVSEDCELFQSTLSEAFGHKLAGNILASIISADWDALTSKVWEMKVMLLRRVFWKQPVTTATTLCGGYRAKRRLPEGVALIVQADTALLGNKFCEELLELAERWHIFVPPKRKIIRVGGWMITRLDHKTISRVVRSGGVAVVNYSSGSKLDLSMHYPVYRISLNDKLCVVTSSGFGWEDNVVEILNPNRNFGRTAAQVWNIVLVDRANRKSR